MKNLWSNEKFVSGRKSFLACGVLAGMLAGCMTLSGNYTLKAYDRQGNEINPETRMMASGSGIYTVRNAMCSLYRGATVVIIDLDTGKELGSESPYKCRE